MRDGKGKLEEEDAARKRRNLRNKKSEIGRENRRDKRKADQQKEDNERQCEEPEARVSYYGPVKAKKRCGQSRFLNSPEKGIVTASSPRRTGMRWKEEDVKADSKRQLRSVVEVQGTVENDEPGPRLKSKIVVPSRDQSPPPQSPESNRLSSTNVSRSSHSSIHKHECQEEKCQERSYNGNEENSESGEIDERHGKVKLKDEIEREEGEVEAADKRYCRWQSVEVQELDEYEHHIISEYPIELSCHGRLKSEIIVPVRDQSPSQSAESDKQSNTEDSKRKRRHGEKNLSEKKRSKKEKHRDKCEPEETKTHSSDTWQDPLGELGPTQLKELHNPACHVAASEDVDENYDGVVVAYYLSSTDISKELTDPGIYDKCQRILIKDKQNTIGTNYEDDHEEVIRPEMRIATTIPSSLLPCLDKSVFQRAMSLYKKQKEENMSLLESYLKED